MEIFFNIKNVSTVFCDKGFMTLQNKSINFLIKKKPYWLPNLWTVA